MSTWVTRGHDNSFHSCSYSCSCQSAEFMNYICWLCWQFIVVDKEVQKSEDFWTSLSTKINRFTHPDCVDQPANTRAGQWSIPAVTWGWQNRKCTQHDNILCGGLQARGQRLRRCHGESRDGPARYGAGGGVSGDGHGRHHLRRQRLLQRHQENLQLHTVWKWVHTSVSIVIWWSSLGVPNFFFKFLFISYFILIDLHFL